WLPFRDQYLHDILWSEGRRGMGDSCSRCHTPSPHYRCVEDECVGSGMMCAPCTLEAHAFLPLHFIEMWNNKYFKLTTLKELGLVIQLGHLPGEICLFHHNAHSDFTVIHTNGIHEVAVKFCGCNPLLEHRTQLLQIQWYPATPINPQTATTFTCLRQFQHLNCLGKLPPYDYYHALEIMTESRVRRKPKERYRVFLRSIFQWRHLKMLKRAGRGHSPGGVAGTGLGELALLCPACPHAGKNLPDDWKDVAPELAFLYFMFLAIDANFRLRNRIVSNHYRSPTLGDGWAYMVPSEPYKEHLAKHTNEEDVSMSSCSGFAAMFLANLKNVKGLRVSGVGGVCCGRHRVWRGNGLGDLQKGERYSNMDFVFWSSIQGEDYLCIVVSYDISCQWSRKFWDRMDVLDPSIKIKYTKRGIIFMVPKFHLRAHQPGCHVPYSFNYAPGCGQTHGEVIEEGWAQSNKASAQTKEMGPGTRAMTLDDIFGFCNWRTIQNLDKVLGKRLINAVKEFDEHYEDFMRFDSGLKKAIGQKALDEWKDMITTWDEDHSQPCPYDISGGDDFFKKMQLKLAEEEHQQLAQGEAVHSSSLCVFIVQGVEIQEAHLDLFMLTNKSLTPTQQLELQKRRSSLLKRIQHFRSLQSLLMPRISDVLSPDEMKLIDCPDNSRPEKIPLFLPSDCGTTSARNRACVSGLPAVEAQLREAEARDALEGVREGLRARTATHRYKIRNVTGQVESTRAGGVLRQIDIRIHSKKIRYRLARKALLRLDGCGKWDEELKELKDEDILGLNEQVLTRQEAKERESTRGLSWIWHGIQIKKGDAEFRDVVRVEWCKARARMLRWQEEVLLLTEELRRMHHYAIWKAEWWMKRRVDQEKMLKREDVSAELAEGLDAYAWQQTQFQVDEGLKIRERWGNLTEHARKVLDRIPDLPTLYLELEDNDSETSAAVAAEESM
ncbi:hypothetical protein K435DRAFT_669246, partial [Dendrothele bispora CBS 962.96]